MFLVFNSDILSEEQIQLRVNDRAFQYGDGLFETIRYEAGRLWYWPDHVDRLTAGMAALQLRLPDNVTDQTLYERIQQLLSANALTHQPARVRIQVWRKPGGLYTPVTQAANVLITAGAAAAFTIAHKARTGIYDAFRVTQSPVSAFKTINALPYVLAGLYKQEHKLDEVLLLDAAGHLAECLASNLFWYAGHTLFTPALQTGCIQGILRRQLWRLAANSGMAVVEGLYRPPVLAQAEAVFCTNVMGIQWLHPIGGSAPVSPSAEALLNGLFAQLQH